MAYFRIGSTEIPLVLILANAVVFWIGNSVMDTPLGEFSLYDTIGIVLAVLFLLAFIVVVVTYSRTLARAEQSMRS